MFDDGTLGLIDFGAVGRLDPIQQSAVVDMLAAFVQRDVGLLRDGIERVADVDVTRVGRSVWSGRWRGCMADERAGDRHGRADRVAGPHSRAVATFGIRLPGDLVVLSRALVTLDGTLRVLAPDCRWLRPRPR